MKTSIHWVVFPLKNIILKIEMNKRRKSRHLWPLLKWAHSTALTAVAAARGSRGCSSALEEGPVQPVLLPSAEPLFTLPACVFYFAREANLEGKLKTETSQEASLLRHFLPLGIETWGRKRLSSHLANVQPLYERQQQVTPRPLTNLLQLDWSDLSRRSIPNFFAELTPIQYLQSRSDMLLNE